MAGTTGFRGVEANIDEVITWRNAMWALSDAMARGPSPGADRFVLPNSQAGAAYHVLGPDAYVQVSTRSRKPSPAV
jgi:4-hydroxyphenylacetate 3-monooxygenase